MRIKELNTKAEGLIETGSNLELLKIRYQDSLNEANSNLSDAYSEFNKASKTDEDGNYVGDAGAAMAHLAEVRSRIEYIEAELKECDYEIERNRNEKRDTYDDIDDIIRKEDHNVRILKELQTKNFGQNANAVLADLIARLNSGEREKDKLNESMGEAAPGMWHSGGGIGVSPSAGARQSGNKVSGAPPIALYSTTKESKPNILAENTYQEKAVSDQNCQGQADKKETIKPIMNIEWEEIPKEANCKTLVHEKSENLREVTDINTLLMQSERGEKSGESIFPDPFALKCPHKETRAAGGRGANSSSYEYLKFKELLVKGDVLENSKEIISGDKLGDEMLISELIKDGSSIDDWSKMESLYSYTNKYGRGKIHYYKNKETGEISYYDAKMKVPVPKDLRGNLTNSVTDKDGFWIISLDENLLPKGEGE